MIRVHVAGEGLLVWLITARTHWRGGLAARLETRAISLPRAARPWCGCDVGVRAGPDPCHEGARELWRSFQGQAAASERLPGADPLQVYFAHAIPAPAGDDGLAVSAP